jgi:hypothetical protein
MAHGKFRHRKEHALRSKPPSAAKWMSNVFFSFRSLQSGRQPAVWLSGSKPSKDSSDWSLRGAATVLIGPL